MDYRPSFSLRLLLLSILLSGCAPQMTELVVVVDADYAVPTELDEIEIVVTEADGRVQSTLAALDVTPLPVVLHVAHRAGATSPVRVEAQGRLAGVARVTRRAVTGFVVGEARELRLDLVRACDGDPCPASQTCVSGTCVAPDVAPQSLTRFDGVVRRLDARDGGILDAGDGALDVGEDAPGDAGCVPTGPEVCDGRDQNCNGVIDEGVCACTPACALDHALAICTVAMTCAISRCDDGYSNCDGMVETGCERPIHTLTDCGGCDVPCGSADGSTSCADGTCRIVTCSSTRFADCNGEVADGCETDTNMDASHCGDCATVCPAGGRCRAGVCR